MEKVLSQTEIDTLFRAAQGAPASSAAPPAEVQVEPWDLHQAGILGKEQVHSLSELHEGLRAI